MNASGNRGFEKLTDRNFQILDVLLEVSRELGHLPAEVARNWAATPPAVSSVISGATKTCSSNLTFALSISPFPRVPVSAKPAALNAPTPTCFSARRSPI